MSAFGLNRFAQAFAVAVNDAGTRLNERQLTSVDLLAWRLFGWGGSVDLDTTFRFCYPFVGGTAVAHSFNLADPNTGRIEWVDDVTHSSLGIIGDGVSGYGKTGVTLAGPLASDAYVTCGVYSRTASTGDNFVEFSNYIQETPLKGGLYISARQTSGLAIVYMGANAASGAVPNSQGLFTGLRNSATVMVGYRNGVALTAGVTTANLAVDPPVPVLLLAHRLGDPNPWDPDTEVISRFSNRNLAFAFLSNKVGTPGIGAIFTAVKQSELYSYIQTFQTRLGRQV